MIDISVNSFCGGRCEKTYRYIHAKVFNPHTPCNPSTNAKKIYRKHKKRSYEAHIHEVEQSSLTTLIFSATGGMAATAGFNKHLASLLSDKWDKNLCSCNEMGTMLPVLLTIEVSN